MMITLYSSELLDDLRAAAFLESELHSGLDLHRRHEMADICETGNIDRVWRVLSLAAAEVRMALKGNHRWRDMFSMKIITNRLETPDEFRFPLTAGPERVVSDFLKETIHDYMIARVMADRTAVIIPDASDVWVNRAENAMSSLREASIASRQSLKPVTRPLFPL